MKKKILVIDDDQTFHDIYRGVLEENGFEMLSAMNPDDGIELVEKENPDLVILDIMMPDGFEGFDVARSIREKLNKTELPIIVMSSVHEAKKVPYRFSPDKKWLPIDIWLDKPFSPPDLMERIHEALNITPGKIG